MIEVRKDRLEWWDAAIDDILLFLDTGCTCDDKPDTGALSIASVDIKTALHNAEVERRWPERDELEHC